MFPTLVCNKTFVPPTYNGSVSDVGEVVTGLVGAGVGVSVKVVGAGVDVGDIFAGCPDCPNAMYAPTPMRMIAIIPIAKNRDLLDLRFDLLFLLGAMSM
jgi:hypothetical protein